MTSDKGASGSGFDERLTAARDAVLAPGEKVTAQEEGDQGQGIFLTDSRVIIAKVGITATGSSNGRITGSFPLEEISAVNLRKGPLGAVLQVCTAAKQCSGPEGPPDNVIVFTGSQRVKRAEAMAGRVESALGKPVNRIEVASELPQQSAESASPQASPVTPPDLAEGEVPAQAPKEKKSKGGRQPSTLADEMFAELSSEKPEAPAAEPAPVAAAKAPPPAQPAPVAAVVAETPSPEPDYDYGPNPYLPKPARAAGGISRVAIVLGGLMAATLVGVAVTAPLRAPQTSASVELNSGDATSSLPVVRKQCAAVRDYSVQVAALVAPASQSLARIEAAVTSGKSAAVAEAIQGKALEDAYRNLRELQAPPGLAGAKESLTSGLFIGRTAAGNISAAIRSSQAVDSKDAVARVREARSQIARGLKMIDAMQRELESKAAKAGGSAKSR